MNKNIFLIFVAQTIVIPRSRLGPDLVFVVLDMTLEQQMDRIRGRHNNDETAVEMMKVGTL